MQAPDTDRLRDHKFWEELELPDPPPVLAGATQVGWYDDASLYVVEEDYGVRMVLMFHGPPKRYRYWVWDEATAVISHYEGDHGDVELDTLVNEYLH